MAREIAIMATTSRTSSTANQPNGPRTNCRTSVVIATPYAVQTRARVRTGVSKKRDSIWCILPRSCAMLPPTASGAARRYNDPSRMIGRTVSHYRIVRELGAGGMGVVYAAEDVRLGRQVAIKFVPDAMADDKQL